MDGPLSSNRFRPRPRRGGNSGGSNHPSSSGGGGGGPPSRYNSHRRHHYHHHNRHNNSSHRGGGPSSSSYHHRPNTTSSRHHTHRGGGGSSHSHHSNRYHHNNNNSPAGGGGGGNSNRISSEAAASGGATKENTPQNAMLRQLSAMIAKMGDWNAAAAAAAGDPSSSSSGGGGGGDNDDNDDGGRHDALVQVIARNVRDLGAVLCGPSTAPQFLCHEEDGIGPLARLVVDGASCLPLESISYAALTVTVERGVWRQKGESGEMEKYVGFSGRCVKIACMRMARDLEIVMRRGVVDEEEVESEDTMVDAFGRCKSLLRYLGLLARVGVVVAEDEGESEDEEGGLSLAGLLKTMAGIVMSQNDEEDVAMSMEKVVMAVLVLSTLPYVMTTISREVIVSLVDGIDATVTKMYQSPYRPEGGTLSLRLKEEQYDAADDSDDEEDDDDDDDDDEEQGPGCYDTLQDLLRTCRTLLESPDEVNFSLLHDAPWDHINDAAGEDEQTPTLPPPLRLTITLPATVTSRCRLRAYLPLSHIVHGRFPLFSPPDPEEPQPADKYMERFSSSTRYFLLECVVDVLVCHRPRVTPSGLERGSCRDVAQQLQALNHLFPLPSIEYGIVESLLTLMAQSHHSHFILSSSYLSRVLVELTKLAPQTVPIALVGAVACLIQELTSVVPPVRDVLSRWFGYHLVNTEFQWPSAYWNHWGGNGGENGGMVKGVVGDFVKRALLVMTAYTSRDVVEKECMSMAFEKEGFTMGVTDEMDDEENELEKELKEKMWDRRDDADTLWEWLESKQQQDDDGKSKNSIWQSRVVTRAVLNSAEKLKNQILSNNIKNDDDVTSDTATHYDNEEILPSLLEAISRYASLLRNTTKTNVTDGDDNGDMLASCPAAIAILNQVTQTLPPSTTCLYFWESTMLALQKHNIVTPISMLQFALGDCGDDHEEEEEEGVGNAKQDCQIMPRWWHLVLLSCQTAVMSLLKRDKDNLSEVVMSLDENAKDASATIVMKQISETMEKIVNTLSSLLRKAIFRVAALVTKDAATASSSPTSGKKLSAIRVSLLEGLKYLVFKVQLETVASVREHYYNETDDSVRQWAVTVLNSKEMNVSGSLAQGIGGGFLANDECLEVDSDEEGASASTAQLLKNVLGGNALCGLVLE